MPKRLNEMVPQNHRNSFKSLILLYLCVLAIFYFGISCSSVNKVKENKETPFQIELNLIEKCIREFINSAAENPDLWVFDVTLLKGIEKHRQDEKNNWLLGDWYIQHVGSQNPIASYGRGNYYYELTLSKKNGVYEVINIYDEESHELEEIFE